MVATTTSHSSIVRPEQVGALLIQPAFAASVAAQVCRRVEITNKSLRLPVVKADPSAAWVAEGQEIAVSDADLGEVLVSPTKVAGLSTVTAELADDSSPEAAAVVGDGLARDIARKIDIAFFGNQNAPAPKGLLSLTGAGGATTVAAPSAWKDGDPFEAALYAAAGVEATLNAWVAHPDDALALAQIKQAEGSNAHLLQPDATQATRRVLAGLPLLTSTAVTPGTVWGIPSDRVVLVVRDEDSIDFDRSVFFTSHRVAIRAVMRVGFGFPHPQAVVKIVRAAA